MDKITARQYAVNLDENLYNLYERLCRGQYAASPVWRVWVDKEDGKKRPIGIPAPEDKIVQKASWGLYMSPCSMIFPTDSEKVTANTRH